MITVRSPRPTLPAYMAWRFVLGAVSLCKSHEIYSQAMWGAPAPPPREATPPPPVERLPGYLEVAPVKVYQSVFQWLFLGAGQSDSGGQTCVWQWRN